MSVATLSINGCIDTYEYYDSVSLQSLKNALAVQEPYESLTVFINSYGGAVTEGLAIYDWLRSLSVPVTTVIIGMCYSIAGPIFMAGSIRLISEHSELMIHPVFGYAEGTAEEIIAYAALMENYGEKIVNLFASVSGLSSEVIAEYMDSTTYLNSSQCVSLGFASGIYTSATAKADRKSLLMNVGKRKPKGVNSDSQNQPKEMASTNPKKSPFAKALEDLKNAFKGVKNLDVTLADGTMVYIDTVEVAVVVGDSVYSDATYSTPVADGDYLLTDGTTITTVSGVVTAVSGGTGNKAKPEDKDGKIAELEATLAELKEGQEAQNSAIEELTTGVTEMLNVVKASLSGKVSKDPNLANNSTGSQSKNAGGASKSEAEMTFAERRAANLAAKEGAKAKK